MWKLDQEVRSPSKKAVSNQNHGDNEQVVEKNAHTHSREIKIKTQKILLEMVTLVFVLE